MTYALKITRQEQLRWFYNFDKKDDYLICDIIYEEIPIGACGLKNIRAGSAGYWGYISNKEFWGKGIGNEILCLIELEVKKIKFK